MKNSITCLILSLLCLASSTIVTSSAMGASVTADSLEQKVSELRQAADYARAVKVAEELLDNRKTDSNAQTWELEDAERLVETLQFIAALPESAQIELSEADKLTPSILTHIGKNEIREGEADASQQLEVRKRLLPVEHYEISESLGFLAYIAWQRGDYTEAERFAIEALAISRKALGDQHPLTAGYAYYLGTILSEKGEYNRAESLLREVLALYRILFDEKDQQVLVILNNLGNVLHEMGDYISAEPLFREAYAVRKEMLGDKHPDVALSAHNLAALLEDRGDVSTAEPLYREAIAINESWYGDRNPNLAICFNSLAVFLRNQDRYAEADTLFTRVLTIQRNVYGETHPDIALTLQNIGMVQRKMGNPAEAEIWSREALAMHKKFYSSDHPRIARNEYNLAHCLLDEGRYDEAENLFRVSLDKRIRSLGGEHPDVVSSLVSLAGILREQGKYSSAESILVQATSAFETARLRVGTGSARAIFTVSPYKELALVRLSLGKSTEAWQATEKSMGRVLADLLLSSNQRLLTPTELAVEDSLKKSLVDLEQQLSALKEAASDDTTGSIEKQSREVYTRLLASEASISKFQKEISSKYPITEGQPFDFSRIQAAIKPETAILGWIDDYRLDSDTLINVWIYVIGKEGSVHWARSKPDNESLDIKQTSEEYRLAMATRPGPFTEGTAPHELCRHLYDIRIAPVEDMLIGIADLVVIPSDGMRGLPVESLIDKNGTYIGERFRIRYSSSATIYAWQVAQSQDRDSIKGQRNLALFIADPPFNQEQAIQMANEMAGEVGDELSASASREPVWKRDEKMIGALRGGNRDVLSELPRLRGARGEVQRASHFFADQAELLLGPDASEQALVAVSDGIGNYSVIHFATHAIMDDMKPRNCALILSQMDLPDPLAAFEHSERIYDGRWTAEEVLSEWSLDADLVVLSGCETALGRQISGEGYIGFAQAFLQAGARGLIMSLWEVDDESTALLMERFYSYLFEPEIPGEVDTSERSLLPRPEGRIAEALRKAKYDVRNYTENGKKYPYSHPWYWAGFILIGGFN